MIVDSRFGEGRCFGPAHWFSVDIFVSFLSDCVDCMWWGGERCQRRHTSRFDVVYWFVVVRSFVRLLVRPLVGWLIVGWFVFSLFRWFVGWLVGSWVGCMMGWLVLWLVCWLAGSLVGLVG